MNELPLLVIMASMPIVTRWLMISKRRPQQSHFK